MMIDEFKFGVILFEPLWSLTISDKVNITYPWGESLHAAKPVTKQVPVAIADILCIALCILFTVCITLGSPYGICSINPYQNEINFTRRQTRFHLFGNWFFYLVWQYNFQKQS